MTEKTLDEELSQRAANDQIAAFESEYQTEQLLNSDAGVEATITDVGWRDSNDPARSGAIFLTVSVPGAVEYPVIVPRLGDVERGNDFVALCDHLGVEPGRDLSGLLDRAVDVDISSHEGRTFVVIDAGSSVVRAQVLDDPGYVAGAEPTLPAAVARALRRLYRYRRNDDGLLVRIDELSGAGDDIVLHLEDGLGDVRLPRERAYEDGPQTAYERLVEEVGQGSVTQIAGGHLYVVPASEVSGRGDVPFAAIPRNERATLYDEYLMTVDDAVGEWAVFLEEPSRKVEIGPLAGIVGAAAGLVLVLGAVLASASVLFVGIVLLALAGVVFFVER